MLTKDTKKGTWLLLCNSNNTNNEGKLKMYKNNSGVIAKTKVQQAKKMSVLIRQVGDINPLLFLY